MDFGINRFSGGYPMHNDSKIGGILSIVSGAFGILYMLLIIFVLIMLYYMSTNTRFSRGYSDLPPEFMNIMYVVYGAMGIFMALLGVLAIIGGIYSLKRKYWGWALAGAIASSITFFPCGIAALIFIAKGQADFKKPSVNAEGIITTGPVSSNPPVPPPSTT
jgi:hypothetical protein